MTRHLQIIQQLHQHAEAVGQFNARSTGLAVARNLYAIQPLTRDGSEFEVQFVDRKAWLVFARQLQAVVAQEGWTAKRVVRMVADGVGIHQAYCCAIHTGHKYLKETPQFHAWVQRLLSHAPSR